MAKSNEARRDRRVCMNAGDLAPLVKEFTHHLSNLGHARRTVRGYEWPSRHLVQWLTLTGVTAVEIDDRIVDRFARHRCRCPGIRCAERLSARYMAQVRRFLEFLGERKIVRCKAKDTPPAFNRRVLEFQDWLRQHRGIREVTIDRHGRMIMRLLPALGGNSKSWDAKLIRGVILAERKRASIATVKQMITALRGYLRFLGARRLCRTGLDQAVPTIPQWRLSALPRYIGVSDVERLIATCDQTTPIGLRDRAILLVLTRLGLRAGDILSLRLTEIDWRQATLLVCGKGRRKTRLPLQQDVVDSRADLGAGYGDGDSRREIVSRDRRCCSGARAKSDRLPSGAVEECGGIGDGWGRPASRLPSRCPAAPGCAGRAGTSRCDSGALP